jgi:anti-sigma B factor antagonist
MIITEQRGNIDIVRFPFHNINALNSNEIKAEIKKVSGNASPRIIVDLGGVEYIDSTGFSCFLSLIRDIRESYGRMKFANPEPGVLSVMKELQLHTIIELFTDLESCIQSFGSNG